jgi:hypothetical protein
MGTAYGSAAAILIAYWDALTGLAPLSFLWVGPVSLIVSLLAGWLFSQLPLAGRSRGTFAAGAVLGIAALAAAVVALLHLNR